MRFQPQMRPLRQESGKFAKTAPALEIKAGVVEGNYFDAEGMKAIAAVPSREELLSRLLEAYSLRLQILRVFLTRSQSRAVQPMYW